MIGLSSIPCGILLTTQKPDILLINRNKQIIIPIELTVCFGTNILQATNRKRDRYAALYLVTLGIAIMMQNYSTLKLVVETYWQSQCKQVQMHTKTVISYSEAHQQNCKKLQIKHKQNVIFNLLCHI